MAFAAIAIQCTAPDGRVGTFLFKEGAPCLGHRFMGPRDARRMASPIFDSLADLYPWAVAQGIEFEPGLTGRAVLQGD